MRTPLSSGPYWLANSLRKQPANYDDSARKALRRCNYTTYIANIATVDVRSYILNKPLYTLHVAQTVVDFFYFLLVPI